LLRLDNRLCLMSVKKLPSNRLTAVVTTPASDDSFITPKQLAERLQVKVSTIWEWTRRRQQSPIPHYPVSRKVVYYRWSEVVAWIQSQRVAA
jgi:predicted DNA-binding transcriptional regulator AlpA